MEYHRNSGLTKQEWDLDKLAYKIKKTECSLTCIKILEEALNIHSVSNRRELLIAAFERLDIPLLTMIEIGEYKEAVDEILSY